MKKTSIILDDQTWQLAKQKSLKIGLTLKSYIAQLIQNDTKDLRNSFSQNTGVNA